MNFPHNTGCGGCREAKICNYCGGPVSRQDRCTNGRCPKCHASICTGGGMYEESHGSGLTREQVREATENERHDHHNDGPKILKGLLRF